MSQLNKFPFKAMIPIVEFLNSQGSEVGKEIYEIQDASDACYSDTSEVLLMLAFLTTFGQVEETTSGWILTNKQVNGSKKIFREFYLIDTIQILNLLSASPQTSDQINDAVQKKSKKEVLEYLHFLQALTKYGFVKKDDSGWKIEKYSPLPEIEAD